MFVCQKLDPESPSIKDLSPLSSCSRLKELFLGGNHEIKDLFPLSACPALEKLGITLCPLITSLSPLSRLMNLKELLWDIHPETSLLPLASCTGLKQIHCSPDAVDLESLRKRRPDLTIKLVANFD